MEIHKINLGRTCFNRVGRKSETNNTFFGPCNKIEIIRTEIGNFPSNTVIKINSSHQMKTIHIRQMIELVINLLTSYIISFNLGCILSLYHFPSNTFSQKYHSVTNTEYKAGEDCGATCCKKHEHLTKYTLKYHKMEHITLSIKGYKSRAQNNVLLNSTANATDICVPESKKIVECICLNLVCYFLIILQLVCGNGDVYLSRIGYSSSRDVTGY